MIHTRTLRGYFHRGRLQSDSLDPVNEHSKKEMSQEHKKPSTSLTKSGQLLVLDQKSSCTLYEHTQKPKYPETSLTLVNDSVPHSISLHSH